jgi:hypothetical protein
VLPLLLPLLLLLLLMLLPLLLLLMLLPLLLLFVVPGGSLLLSAVGLCPWSTPVCSWAALQVRLLGSCCCCCCCCCHCLGCDPF